MARTKLASETLASCRTKSMRHRNAQKIVLTELKMPEYRNVQSQTMGFYPPRILSQIDNIIFHRAQFVERKICSSNIFNLHFWFLHSSIFGFCLHYSILFRFIKCCSFEANFLQFALVLHAFFAQCVLHKLNASLWPIRLKAQKATFAILIFIHL